jgi:invasion protein IalB
MKICPLQRTKGRSIKRFAALASVACLAAWGFSSAGVVNAIAQQPAAKKAPEKKPAAKADAKAQPTENVSAWVKLCKKAPTMGKGSDGKPVTEEREICATQHEQIGVDGRLALASSVLQAQGIDKLQLSFRLPLGVVLPPGLAFAILSKEDGAAVYDKISKKEQIDETKIVFERAPFITCFEGCSAEVEATPDTLNKMKLGSLILVRFVAPTGQSVTRMLPLQGFAEAFTGKPADIAQHQQGIRAAIAARQDEMLKQDPELAALIKLQQEAQKNLEEQQKRSVSQDPKLAEAIKQMQDVQAKLVEHARSRQQTAAGAAPAAATQKK